MLRKLIKSCPKHLRTMSSLSRETEVAQDGLKAFQRHDCDVLLWQKSVLIEPQAATSEAKLIFEVATPDILRRVGHTPVVANMQKNVEQVLSSLQQLRAEFQADAAKKDTAITRLQADADSKDTAITRLQAEVEFQKFKTDQLLGVSVQVILRHIVKDVERILWPLAAKQVGLFRKSQSVPPFALRFWNDWIDGLADDEAIGGCNTNISSGVYRDLSRVTGGFLKRVMWHAPHADTVDEIDGTIPIGAGNIGAHFPSNSQQAMALVMTSEDKNVSIVQCEDLTILVSLVSKEVQDKFLTTLRNYEDLRNATQRPQTF